ncbi:MAG: V-type ATPase 116kDa subunit family protein [Elusimicrobiota bacterium]|nr:V-type ATPase 116kDa subunit family protein [Elusimicrobiota bacterium]
MAIDKIKKSIFIIPSDIFETFLVELKNISSVEIISQQDIKATVEEQSFLGYTYQTIKMIISKLEFLLTLISKYRIFIPTDLTSQEVFISYSLNSDLEQISNLYTEIEQIDREIKSIHTNIQNLQNKKVLIENFSGINLSFSKLRQLKNYKYFFLRINVKKLNSLIKELQKLRLSYYWIHRKVKDVYYFFVLIHNSEENNFFNLTRLFEIQILNITQEIETDSIEEEIKIINKKIADQKMLLKELEEKIKILLTPNIKKIISTYVQAREVEDFILAQQNTTKTKYSKILSCWVPEKFINKVKNLVNKFTNVSVLFIEPQKGEDIPTVLRNKPISEPYEFITTLYGYPKINTVDPTNFLAPFFTLFFALCVSDVFYGILLTLTWVFLRNKVPKYSEYYKLVTLLKYLGLTSIVIGFLLDSFLGFSVVRNFKLPLNIAVFDPLNRPIDMLKFTFLLGFVQIIFGLFINTIKSYKDNDILSSIDNLSWVLFIFSFAPVVYNLFFPKDISESLLKTSGRVSLAIFLFIVIFQSRNIKSILLKPVNILVKGYNVIGFYADILSYSRILALALASSAIAQTINILVGKLLKAELLGIKFLEPILAPIVFVGGHIFNFLLGCLGAFVHSARLQFLEFFSKFFVAGGRPIKLFTSKKEFMQKSSL